MKLRAMALAAACAAAACGRPVPGGPNVLLVIIDTVRSDHLGCYGYSRNTTPSLDSLASRGTLFLNTMSQSPWTIPSTASIFTGLTPAVHRVGMIDGVIYGLDPALPTASTLMSDAGYATFGEFSVAWLRAEMGFDTGFDHFHCYSDHRSHCGEIVDSLAAWIDSLPAGRPWFAIIHFYEPHDPYAPHQPYDTLFAGRTPPPFQGDSIWLLDDSERLIEPLQREALEIRYDGELRQVDDSLSRLFGFLRAGGHAGNTLVIVTADHGEEFLDHGGTGHGRTFYQEILSVPLILSGPGIPRAGKRRDLAAGIDILPTILETAGIPLPDFLEGVSLLGPAPDRAVPASSPKDGNMVCIGRGMQRQIWDPADGSVSRFDLTTDPDELNPLPADSTMMDDLGEYRARTPLGNPAATPEGELDNSLRDLGYI
jgi:arylsulfatase A-like enzyme